MDVVARHRLFLEPTPRWATHEPNGPNKGGVSEDEIFRRPQQNSCFGRRYRLLACSVATSMLQKRHPSKTLVRCLGIAASGEARLTNMRHERLDDLTPPIRLQSKWLDPWPFVQNDQERDDE